MPVRQLSTQSTSLLQFLDLHDGCPILIQLDSLSTVSTSGAPIRKFSSKQKHFHIDDRYLAQFVEENRKLLTIKLWVVARHSTIKLNGVFTVRSSLGKFSQNSHHPAQQVYLPQMTHKEFEQVYANTCNSKIQSRYYACSTGTVHMLNSECVY